MKTVNGKLLGQLSEESEVVKQQINLRYGQIESLLTKQREYQLMAYQTEVEKFQTLCQEVGERIENLESSKSDRHDTSLYRTKQQAPLKASLAYFLKLDRDWTDFNLYLARS